MQCHIQLLYSNQVIPIEMMKDTYEIHYWLPALYIVLTSNWLDKNPNSLPILIIIFKQQRQYACKQENKSKYHLEKKQ